MYRCVKLLRVGQSQCSWLVTKHLSLLLRRNLYSNTGKWEKPYTQEVRKELESFWKNRIKDQHKRLQLDGATQEGRGKYYVLSMFPYPSGRLHMGHVRVYTISDAMARYHRMTGKQVIHPMGWDAFGLPAENAAIERGELPEKWTYSNIANMKKQLKDLCYSFDWDTEYATCDPAYYRWTQWIFLKMYEAGLVYQKEAMVNWDPVDHTVLADEQIDENGRSWRSGALAEKRSLRQWYIRTTAYAKSLWDGLEEVDPTLWKDIISMQQNWIGECKGTSIRFKLQQQPSGQSVEDPLSVYTENPELLYGVSHILLAPEHPLNKHKYYKEPGPESQVKVKELNLQAVHPLTNHLIPIYVSAEMEFPEFVDAHLGIPCASEADRDFAIKNAMTAVNVLDEQGNLINSDQFSGLSREDAFKKVTNFARDSKFGGEITSAKLRDWLISRQRYWGTPIPMIKCGKCGSVPVPYDDLPVELPEISKFTGKGASPLSSSAQWLNVTCPSCGGEAERETDTMDTFVDSSWYYLRYLDPQNTQLPFDPSKGARALPVDLYIGGKEHAVMHLYYARFFGHFLHDLGMVPQREPFVNLLTQGMVMGQSYRLKDSGQYIPEEDVEFSGETAIQKGTGAAIETQWEKMSKSKHNGVDPEEMLELFGVDSTRLCILSAVPPKAHRNWSKSSFKGILHWQNRIWALVDDLIAQRNLGNHPCTLSPEEVAKAEERIYEARNYFLKEVTFHYNVTFLLSVGISRLQGLTNTLKKVPLEVVRCSPVFEDALASLVTMLAPVAPHFASELWQGMAGIPNNLSSIAWDKSLLEQPWPEVDMKFPLPLIIKNNGQDMCEIKMPRSDLECLVQAEAVELAKQQPRFKKRIGDLPVQGVSYSLTPGYKAEINFTIKVPKKAKKNKKVPKESASVSDS